MIGARYPAWCLPWSGLLSLFRCGRTKMVEWG